MCSFVFGPGTALVQFGLVLVYFICVLVVVVARKYNSIVSNSLLCVSSTICLGLTATVDLK